MPDNYAIKPGDKVPEKLPLALSSGETAKLGDYPLGDGSGQWLVLYFYPKDSTPGCTTEGIDFNALLPKFRKLGATVLGVSRDSIRSHQNFCAKQGFRFDLVSDADEALCRAFDVIHEKNMYGRKVMGIERSTFLVRSEEHTSELQSLIRISYAVFCLNKQKRNTTSNTR